MSFLMGYPIQVVCLEHMFIQATLNELSKLCMCNNNKREEDMNLRGSWECKYCEYGALEFSKD